MGRVWLVHFHVTGLRNHPPVENSAPNGQYKYPRSRQRRFTKYWRSPCQQLWYWLLCYTQWSVGVVPLRTIVCGDRSCCGNIFVFFWIGMIGVLYPSSYCTVIFPGAMAEHFSGNGGAEATGSTSRFRPCCKNVVDCGHLVGTRSPAVPWQDVNPQETQFGFDWASSAPVFVATQL